MKKRTTAYMLEAGLVPQLRAEVERLLGLCLRDRAEVERLQEGLRMLAKQEYDAGYTPEEYADAILSGHEPRTIERLQHIEQAAQRAFDYHLRGYGPHSEDFDANTQLALMDELGKALEGQHAEPTIDKGRRGD